MVDCAANQAIVAIKSVHHNHEEDRAWHLECRAIKGHGASISDCSWSGWTGLDAHWKAPALDAYHIIAGVESIHHNRQEDRQYKFKHCRVNGVDSPKHSMDLAWANNYDHVLAVKLPGDQFFAQWESVHHDKYEDRVFKFNRVTYCLKKIPCTWKPWHTWSTCSQKCGGGQRTRSRGQNKAINQGAACSGEDEETEACGTMPCTIAIDCVWGKWGEYGECSVTCGKGSQERTRNKTKEQHGGKACKGKSLETKKCELDKCFERLVFSLESYAFRQFSGPIFGLSVYFLCLAVIGLLHLA